MTMEEMVLAPETGVNTGDIDLLKMPTAVGTGMISTIVLRSGIRLIVVDYKPNKPNRLKYQLSGACFGFGFCLSGNIFSRLSCLKDGFIIEPGQSAVYYFPDLEGSTEETGKEHVLRILIQMKPEEFSSLIGYDLDQLPACVRRVPRADRENPSRFTDPITPAMRTTLYQILSCPYYGLTRNFFVEGKVLELMAYKLEQLGTETFRPKTFPALKSDDIDRTRHARKLLDMSLEDAPDLTELARSVGMCRSKLHYYFCKVYGTTPFDYLRNQRLERARRLLAEGKTNVTEAAYSVGYSSLSHFAKVFKQYFGFLPSQFHRNLNSAPNKRFR